MLNRGWLFRVFPRVKHVGFRRECKGTTVAHWHFEGVRSHSSCCFTEACVVAVTVLATLPTLNVFTSSSGSDCRSNSMTAVTVAGSPLPIASSSNRLRVSKTCVGASVCRQISILSALITAGTILRPETSPRYYTPPYDQLLRPEH